MKRFLLLAILGIAAIAPATAQDLENLTLQECVKIALENNLKVKRSVYNVENFRINLLQNRMAFFPTLQGGATYGKNFGRALNPVSNLYVNRNSTTEQIFATSGVTLFNGLRITNSFRQSKRDLDASDQDLVKQKNDVIINVVTLYTNVIFNKELFENAKYQLNSSQQQVDRIKKQVDAGSLPISNQLNQEAQVATNELNMINQENLLNLSILQLKQAMQLPASTPLDVKIPEIEMEDLVLDQTPEQIYKVAYQTMPEVKSALLKVESAQLSLRATQGVLYPRLSLNGQATSNYSSVSDGPRYAIGSGTVNQPIGFVQATGQTVVTTVPVTNQISDSYNQRDQLKDNLFKSVSLNLTIPIFNGLQARTNVQRAIINRELADITARETENTLRQTIESAYNDAVSAAKSYASSVKQVNARQEAWRVTKQRFDNGAANYVEYLISENDLFAAKSDLSRAKYNFIFKKKLLDFYVGKTIEY